MYITLSNNQFNIYIIDGSRVCLILLRNIINFEILVPSHLVSFLLENNTSTMWNFSAKLYVGHIFMSFDISVKAICCENTFSFIIIVLLTLPETECLFIDTSFQSYERFVFKLTNYILIKIRLQIYGKTLISTRLTFQ